MAPPTLIAGGLMVSRAIQMPVADHENAIAAIHQELEKFCKKFAHPGASALYNQCIEDMTAVLLGARHGSGVDLRAPGAVLIALGLGCVAGCLCVVRHKKQQDRIVQMNIGPNPGRPVTQEELNLVMA